MRHLFPVTVEWIRAREARLIAEEDACIRAAFDEARTPEERAFMERLFEVRRRNAKRR